MEEKIHIPMEVCPYISHCSQTIMSGEGKDDV